MERIETDLHGLVRFADDYPTLMTLVIPTKEGSQGLTTNVEEWEHGLDGFKLPGSCGEFWVLSF